MLRDHLTSPREPNQLQICHNKNPSRMKAETARASASLTSVHLFESSPPSCPERRLLWLWSYPSLDGELRALTSLKIRVLLREPREFRFFRFESSWIYVFLPEGEGSSSGVGVVLVGKEFRPGLHLEVGKALVLTYAKTKDPSLVLQQFLSLVVEGCCQLPKKKVLSLKEFEGLQPFPDSGVKEIISTFGLETILLYSGIQKRKRIAVYHHDVDVLVKISMSIPALCCCDWEEDERWDFVFPWVELCEEDLKFMKDKKFYVMGSRDARIANKTELFDIFVNVPAGEIIVTPQARESITMNKVHKEIAMYMVQLASDEELTEENVIESLRTKLVEVKDKLTAQVRPTDDK